MRKITSLVTLLCLLFLAIGQTCFAGSRPALDRPNLVIVYLDDAGYGDFGFTGNKVVRTPNLDKLAAQGMNFTSFYAGAPACSASRYAIMTGKSPARSRFNRWVLNPDTGAYLRTEEQTLADIAKGAGYSTTIIGKWHLGYPNKENNQATDSLPTAHGFDSWVGIPYSNDMKPSVLLRQKGSSEKYPTASIEEAPVKEDTLTQRYFQQACDYVNKHKSEPFLLYLVPAMPHYPVSASPEFVGKASSGRLYDDVIQEIDYQMGQLVKTIKDAGIAENTLIIFSSDNGPWLMQTPKDQSGIALPFRDGKMSTFEGGIRVPGVFYWPGTIPPNQKNNDVVSVLDILPSFAKLANQPLKTFGKLDGRNILPLLNNKLWTDKVDKDYHVVMTGRNTNVPLSVRWKNWKLHIETYSALWEENARFPHNSPRVEASFDNPLLYDLDNDIAETTNVADQHPEIVEKMKKYFTDFKQSVDDELRETP